MAEIQSQIEPTINIRNKKTGEQKTIPISQAGGFGIGAEKAVEILKSQRQLQQVTETGVIPPEPEAPTEKSRLFKKSAVAARGALKTLTTEGVSTGPISTRLQKFAQLIPGAKATAGTTFRSQLAFNRTIIRNALLGGQISPQEAESLESGLPTEFDQEDIARQKLVDFIKQFGEATDQEFSEAELGITNGVTPQEPKPISDRLVEAGKGIGEFFLGGARNVFEDIGTGLALKGKAGQELQRSQQQALDLAQRVSEKALQTEDPEERRILNQVAQDALSEISKQAGETQEQFSEDVKRGAVSRGLEAGAEIATAGAALTGIPSIAKKAPGAIRAVGKKVGKKIISPFKAKPAKFSKEILEEGLKLAEKGGKTRDVAVKSAQEAGKKVTGSKVFSKISAWAKEAKAGATSSQAKQIDDLVKRSTRFYKGKNLNPVTAKSRWDTATKGFSAAGKAGDTVQAGFHRAVRDGIRAELDKVAPGFEAGTQAIRKGLEREKVLKAIRTSLERSEVKEGLKETPSKALEALKKLLFPAKLAAGVGIGGALFGGGD
ncbi:MAG TPA: hypothetical protein ENI23_10360 [bacterium]|nr:hypothetical protein [bacterium]